MLKDQWTLVEIDALPSGEHDYFDRKSGQLLNDPQFRFDFAKVYSAISNSGGGHIILGVADDGSIDGVPKLKGRTCIREWIEQVIPTLVDPVPTAFRVHRVESFPIGSIPQDRVVIVIDIDDSHLAPFQSRQNHVYYYRVGGHSIPAPHFYLEAVRKRQVAPVLTTSLNGCRVIRAKYADSQLFVQLVVELTVTNEGNVTPSHWHIDLRYNNERLSEEGRVRRAGFPGFALRFLDDNRISSQPILPGRSRKISELIGLVVSTPEDTPVLVLDAAYALFGTESVMMASVITESHVGEWATLDIAKIHRIVTPDEIKRFLPGIADARKDGSLGGGVNSSSFTIDDYSEPDEHVHFRGVIENASEENFKDFFIAVVFLDQCKRG